MDPKVILLVVWMIGANCVVYASGIVYSSISGKPVDNAVCTLAGTALGYLGGLLTRIQGRANEPPTTSVTVPFNPRAATAAIAAPPGVVAPRPDAGETPGPDAGETPAAPPLV